MGYVVSIPLGVGKIAAARKLEGAGVAFTESVTGALMVDSAVALDRANRVLGGRHQTHRERRSASAAELDAAERVCSKCKKGVDDEGAKFCPSCGESLADAEESRERLVRKCDDCGAQLESGDAYCRKCGKHQKNGARAHGVSRAVLATAERRNKVELRRLLSSARAKAVELGMTVGDVLRQAGATEKQLKSFGLTDFELLDSGTARAAGMIGPPDERIIENEDGSISLGLLSPADAKKLLESGVLGGGR